MKPMRRNFTLPELQEKLDNLVEGGLIQISQRDYERLFGANDVASARLRNFAKSHACDASHSVDAVQFRKLTLPNDGSRG